MAFHPPWRLSASDALGVYLGGDPLKIEWHPSPRPAVVPDKRRTRRAAR
jgi:hypothetical protein